MTASAAKGLAVVRKTFRFVTPHRARRFAYEGSTPLRFIREKMWGKNGKNRRYIYYNDKKLALFLARVKAFTNFAPQKHDL